MSFHTYFRASSYAMVACGTLALAVSDGIGARLSIAFALLLAGTWWAEGTRWQLAERSGLVFVLLSLPLFYLNWKYQLASSWAIVPAQAGISSLTHFILFLSVVKLWQVKADRDWLFLYLISFFEILLAAGLSVSPLFVGTLSLYLFCALSTVVCFEIKQARVRVPTQQANSSSSLPDTDVSATLFGTARGQWFKPNGHVRAGEIRRLPLVAFCLLALIFALALPLFFITPRFAASALARSDGGGTNVIGFSDHVSLGEIGQLQQNHQVVLRVRVDEPRSPRTRSLHWRGVALDNFTGRGWIRSRSDEELVTRNEGNLYPFGTTEALERLTTQTFFLEPMDTPVLFVAPRAVALQGALPFVRRDREGGLATREHESERLTYKAYSDTTEPPAAQLRGDVVPYSSDKRRYLQLPVRLDPRIAILTRELIVNARADNRYDAALVVEDYLQHRFGYSLEMKAGGVDPLADFLFRVREGHCEYFSTAMAVMLRTAGVATRVVNGFQTGEYNDAADVYTVRQSDAHSWVEVYFPETDAWVTFDPTPAAGRQGSATAQGWHGQLQKYAEACQLFWIQYVVAYDKQGQRSLAQSFRSQLDVYRQTAAQVLVEARAGATRWWTALQASLMGHGSKGESANSIGRIQAIGLFIVLASMLALLVKFSRGVDFRNLLRRQQGGASGSDTAIVFYERMMKALAQRGLQRAAEQTPLEFAAAVNVPEAWPITRAYNRVRYGTQSLSPDEAEDIEAWLRRLEEGSRV